MNLTACASNAKVAALVGILALVGCADPEPLYKYSPVVDPAKTSMAKFEHDLNACRAIALKVEADYLKRQRHQLITKMAAGALIGTVIGNVYGNSFGHKGEAIALATIYGTALGAYRNDYTYDLVRFGPRRVVDRCIAKRGYKLLNDKGRG